MMILNGDIAHIKTFLTMYDKMIDGDTKVAYLGDYRGKMATLKLYVINALCVKIKCNA